MEGKFSFSIKFNETDTDFGYFIMAQLTYLFFYRNPSLHYYQ